MIDTTRRTILAFLGAIPFPAFGKTLFAPKRLKRPKNQRLSVQPTAAEIAAMLPAVRRMKFRLPWLRGRASDKPLASKHILHANAASVGGVIAFSGDEATGKALAAYIAKREKAIS